MYKHLVRICHVQNLINLLKLYNYLCGKLQIHLLLHIVHLSRHNYASSNRVAASRKTYKELTINSDGLTIKPSNITDITSVLSSIECSKISNSDHTGVDIHYVI